MPKIFENLQSTRESTSNILLLTNDANKNETFVPYTKNYYLQNPNQKTYEDDTLKEKIGESKHYPPATKEWVNSTYSYNKNYAKTLPAADDILDNLIKGYLNMNPLMNKKRSKRVEIRFKRLSLNKILVSKAEMKHTNNKVIVTVYLYNRNKKNYIK